jgi:TRAP-type C4-dicarboxylate transport system permease small subunit
MIIVAIIMLVFASVFVSVGATAIIMNYEELNEALGKYTKPWILIIGGVSTVILMFGGVLLTLQNIESKPEYKLIQEPIYRKI